MGRISSGVGLISGINSRDIIDQLMSLESRPKTTLQTRIQQTNQQKVAWSDLTARLTSLKLSITNLKKISTFQQAKATSSNENVLTASASTGAATGTFQFQVSRLVTTQQSITNGFASEKSLAGAGTLTLEMGGGEVTSQTSLGQLNGGDGVRRGSFRITDRGGKSGVIDISTALSLDDVVKKINMSLDVTVRAEIQGDKLVLNDLSGGAGNLTVTDLGGGHAATDLGIAGSVAAASLAGSDINRIGRATTLATLNDGRGVRTGAGQPDLRITAADGSTFDITVSGRTNVGAVLDAINTAAGGKVTAAVAANGKSIALTDTTGGGGTLGVSALNNSKAATDLGLDVAAVGNTIGGKTLIAGINQVLLSSLRGGAGLDLGQVSFTDRAGHTKVLDFSSDKSIQDVISRINNDADLQLTASLKDSANGIQITDSSGSGDIIIGDVTGSTAAQLGVAGTHTVATAVVRGANMQRQWVSENTLLSTFNGGRGVTLGEIKITNSNGAASTIDLTGATTLGEVIKRISAATIPGSGGTPVSLGVTASVNANGDGLLLTDTAGGAGKLKVIEDGSTTAADLGILGEATATTIDGSFERTIAITATDTITDVLEKISGPGFGLSASIINDGSGPTPYRVSFAARNSGRAGRVVFDAGTTSLGARNLVEAQDAAVFVGGSDTENPLVVTSGTNRISNMIKGVTVDLNGTSSAPVSVNVSSNMENVVGELKKFADAFNGLVERIGDLTKYDSETQARGILLGEGTIQSVSSELYGMMYSSIKDAGEFKSLGDIGLRVTGTKGKIELDEDKLRSAASSSPESFRKLFSLFEKASETTPEKKGLGYLLEDRLNKLIDPTNGIITRKNKTLDARTEQFQDRIGQLDKLLEAKRSRLERQFASMETVLAKLQSQQQALASFTPVTMSAS